jgi:hypothetical protein
LLGFDAFILLLPQPAYADRCPQFERFCLLVTSNGERLEKTGLSRSVWGLGDRWSNDDMGLATRHFAR